MNTVMSWATGIGYKQVVKPILFKIEAEKVHESFLKIGEQLGTSQLTKGFISYLYNYQDPMLSQMIHEVAFPAPVGLAAGFDYDAQLTQMIPSLGFGYHTVGTVTYGAYEGNASPMLGRLPKSKSLMVNKGFKSAGVQAIVNKLSRLTFSIPLGISVGSTNKEYSSIDEQLEEYVYAFEHILAVDLGAYYEVNISCPNLKRNPFDDPTVLDKLLSKVDDLEIKKPIFIKMPIDKSLTEFADLLEIIIKHSVTGVIIGNLAKDRSNPALIKHEVSKFTKGNFSGKPTWEKSNQLISHTYKNYSDRLIIIGCGGIFNALDAYEKMKRGASLVQLITGMVFEGPQLIGQINKSLVTLMKNDGYSHISEVIGSSS